MRVWGLCCSRLSQGGKPPSVLGAGVPSLLPVCLSDCKLIPSLPLCLNHKQDCAHGVCPCTYLWHICPNAQDSRVGKTIRKAVVNAQASVTRAAEELGQPEARTRTPSHLSVGFKDQHEVNWQRQVDKILLGKSGKPGTQETVRCVPETSRILMDGRWTPSRRLETGDWTQESLRV